MSTAVRPNVVAYHAPAPQVRGSILGPGKVDSALHPSCCGSINEYQVCLGTRFRLTTRSGHQLMRLSNDHVH
ncbi:hypothetical protein TNCV_4671311 [Trichonephila clavipes]|nr:hypothetical protein TNCV_4671311 [Trichonephila clavipes]